jgi:hypothetical protein
MTRQAQAWADTHNDELHNVLTDLGASQMMHAFVNVRVPHRHSVVEEMHKWHSDYDEYDGENDLEEAVETARRLGGGFFQTVWEGDVLDAFKQADSNNQRIIAEAYGKDYLLGLCESQMERNIVNERWPY